MPFQQDGHKGSRYRAYVKTDFPSWQQKDFPISSRRLENKVPCPNRQLAVTGSYFVNFSGIHSCKAYQGIHFQCVGKATVQLSDRNNYRKTTWYLLKSCTTSHVALWVRKRELLLPPMFCLVSLKELWAISFLPCGSDTVSGRAVSSEVKVMGWLVPWAASFFKSCGQSQPCKPSLVSTYEYETAVVGRGKNVGLLLVHFQERTSFSVVLISYKKSQEPLHLIWCHICHFLFH